MFSITFLARALQWSAVVLAAWAGLGPAAGTGVGWAGALAAAGCALAALGLGRCRASAARGRRELDAAAYRALADHVPASLIVLSAAERRVVRLNPQAQAEFGLLPEQVIGRSVAEVFGTRLTHQLEGVMQRAVTQHSMVEEEFMVRRGRQAQRTVNARFLATYRADGRPELLVVIARDVTAERMAQHELDESRQRFQEFAATVDDGLFISTPKRDRWEFLSPQALAFWGLSPEDLAANPRALYAPSASRASSRRTSATASSTRSWASAGSARAPAPGACRTARCGCTA